MQDSFETALAHVLVYEGGYSDHPLDPGGATNLGITIGVLRAHRGRAVSKADVRALTRAEAAEIYRARYWRPSGCDALAAGLDLAVFDCAVNQGVSRALRFLAQAKTAARRGGGTALLNEFMARRMQHYGGLRRLFPTFGLGWSRRLLATQAAAARLLSAN